MVEFLEFDKDDAAQQLLGLVGIVEPYEDLIERSCLEILSGSVPDCVIERIRFVLSAGSHPGFHAGGAKLPDDPDQIALQEFTLPFALEIVVRSGASRTLLKATFSFECSDLEGAPRTEFGLEIHSRWNVDSRATDTTA